MFSLRKKAPATTTPTFEEWGPRDLERQRDRINKIETEVVAHREALRQIRDILVQVLEKPRFPGSAGQGL